MKSIVLPIADPHCGLKVGLMPPKVKDKDSTYYQTEAQKWLWQRWLYAKRLIFKLLEQADELVVFLMSDIIHGNKNGHEVFSTRLTTQKDTFIQCVLPFTNRASKSYCVKGTRYHLGDDDIVEDVIAQELGCYGLRAWDKIEIDIQGVKFMLQHKGPSPGTRRHTRGNVMRASLRDAHTSALQEGREVADVYLWSHFHEDRPEVLVVETPKGHKTLYGFILPAWCVANEFALRVVRGLELSDVGMRYFIVEDGKLESKKYVKKFDNVERVKHG